MDTEKISFLLGILSLLLAIYSVWQSYRYKNIADKLDKDKEKILQAIHENTVYSAMVTRNLYQKNSSNKINLDKDGIYVYKNSKYKSCNVSEIIDKFNKELPKVLKQTYIDSIMSSLNLDDESTDLIGIATLRYQYENEDLKKIKELNEIFYEDGITFEIKIC